MPCNHIFHTSCLRSWFQRHQTCPTCRLDILRPTPLTRAAAPLNVPPRTAQAPAAAAATASSSNINDANSRGPSTSNRQNAGINRNPYYNQIPLQYQFRPFTFPHRPASTDDNSNNNDSNSNNGLPQQNNTNEWATFLNASELGGIPSFACKLNPHNLIIKITRIYFYFYSYIFAYN